MNQSEIEKTLDYVDHTRERRTKFANLVLKNPAWIPLLLNIIENEQNPISCKASWALELTVRTDSNIILPYIDQFIKILPKVSLESSIRPIAKICEILSLAYFSKTNNPIQNTLTGIHLAKIAETSFDWLISDHKVAPKAYSMITLFNIGNKLDWIHPELQLIVSQNFNTGSAAYKARGRKVLNAIKKLQKKK